MDASQSKVIPTEQQRLLKRAHHWLIATLSINLLIAGATLYLFCLTLFLGLTNDPSFDRFSAMIIWIGFGLFSVPAGAIVSFISFLVLRKWRELKLPNQNYLLAYLSTALGLFPAICILLLLFIAILTRPA